MHFHVLKYLLATLKMMADVTRSEKEAFCVLVLGDAGTGKTSLVQSSVTGEGVKHPQSDTELFLKGGVRFTAEQSMFGNGTLIVDHSSRLLQEDED